VLDYAGGFLSDLYNVKSDLLFSRENFKMAEKLFRMDYEKLEDNTFRKTIHKHEEAGASRWARFSYFMWTSQVFVKGVFTVAVSVVMILPLLKIGFTKTGNSFFERPVFLILLIATLIVMAAVMALIAVRMNKSYLAANEAYATLDRLFYSLIDLFADYKTGKEIRLYKEQHLIGKIATEKILTDGEKTLKQISMRTAKTSSIVAVMGAFVAFGVYVFIGVKGNLGLFDIGALVMYCGAFMQIVNGVMLIANTLGKLAEILPLARIYFEIIECTDSKQYGTRTLDGDRFEIEFKNVSFKYPGANQYALENVSIKIENGSHLAVVGRNGSGKTTFIKLMCRLYDVTDGEILINGENIQAYTKESIINLYSVVFQDFKIFSVSLKDNVCASTALDTDRLYTCLENANIKERVERLPNKENTYLYKDLNKGGVEISGGEAQKLALARALYKDAPVVVLDEPTAGLDPEERLNFKNVIRRIKGDRCVVLSTHIITDIESLCDRILVLCDGRITAFDSCGALADVARGKVYAVESTADLATPFHSMGPVTVDGKAYEKIISKAPLDAPTLEPTVEDGYICFIEKLS
jgi:ATP-binding cassette subfamily B protein